MKSRLILHLMAAFAVLFLIDGGAFAQIKSNRTGGGAWSSKSTWADGVLPTISDNV